jgi:hypothetical protein
MRHLKNFNESIENGKTLREVIGDIKSTKKCGYYEIKETEKGCIINLDDECMNYTVSNSRISSDGCGEIVLKEEGQGYGYIYYAYFENGFPRIISHVPGDERGCVVFGDVFIASGHDGNYLFNIKTGEFKDNTW